MTRHDWGIWLLAAVALAATLAGLYELGYSAGLQDGAARVVEGR